MNILPKKRWHVKNRDNAARVEADEARFRKQQNEDAVRSLIATQEARAEYLRRKAHGVGNSDKPLISSHETLRLFADVEENRNLFATNKDYEEETRKEREMHEKKLGILKYLGETEDGLANAKLWWSEAPKRDKVKPCSTLLKSEEVDAKRKQRSDPLFQMKQVEEEFARIREAKQMMQSKERAAVGQMMSSYHSLFPNDIKIPMNKRRLEDQVDQKDVEATKVEKRKRMEKLRAERLARERVERERAAVVLCKSMGLSAVAQTSVEEPELVVDERQLPFNSAFNPELSTLAAERRNAHRSELNRRRRSFK